MPSQKLAQGFFSADALPFLILFLSYTEDQPLSLDRDQRIDAATVIHCPPDITVILGKYVPADETQPIDQPSTVLGIGVTMEAHQSLASPGVVPTLIPNEELEQYFSAPLTHPPSGSSSLIHQHL